MTALGSSLQEWLNADVRRTRDQWLAQGRAEWAAIRASEHWHDGVPCTQAPLCPSNKEPST
jgi:hypothetical protein